MEASLKAFEAPHYLSDDEIDDIVGVLPTVAAATAIVANHVREQIQRKLKIQLREYRIAPDVIPELKGYIINQFLRSVVSPGEPIGITTGESIGGPMTQMTLNSFHQTGSAKSMGIDAFRELFNASVHRRNENTTIHFKNKNLSFDEALELRRVIVGTSVGYLTKANEIITTTENGQPLSLMQRGWWYQMYGVIMNKELMDSRYFLRLHLNTTLLYTYKVTLDDVARALEADRPQVLQCVCSPSSVGIIDVYPDERVIRKALTDALGNSSAGITDANASLLFLQLFVAPNLGDVTVKGVPGITQLFPIAVTTWSIVLKEEPYMDESRLETYVASLKANKTPQETIDAQLEMVNRSWLLNLDMIRMRITGISVTKLRETLELVGITVAQAPTDPETGTPQPGENPSRFIITMPVGWEQVANEGEPEPPAGTKRKPPHPGKYVNKLIEKEEAKVDRAVANAKKAGARFPLREVTPLMRAGTYVYAEANGTNLKQMLAHPLIDPRRTISNNPHEILATLGIEACRNFIAREFYDMITGNAAYVNPRYIALIADFMTNMGIVVPITSRGVARQNRGAWADASFEHPVEVFIKAAMSGRWEEVLSTSASIFVGKRAFLGTGYMALGLRNDVLTEIEKRAAAEQDKEVSVEAAQRDAAHVIGDVQFDSDRLRYEEGAVGTLDDAMFNTPDPFGNPASAGYQAPMVVKGAEAAILPLPDENAPAVPIVIAGASLLAPKGPVPRIQVTVLPLAPWVAAIIQVADPDEDESGLPPLDNMDFNSLMGLIAPPPAEAAVPQIDMAAFLA
ncbi:DNA-directed RNA polymerase subunit RPB1 [uncultured virus]|nr:DNA-directed RNA polymerase subunit RPB1 [uncultured virus]